jgi:glycosyltransferase involved in cell wall biosynthesis
MIETHSITGSAKAVLEFAKEATRRHAGLPSVDLWILAFCRRQGESNLTKAIRDIGTPLDIVFERYRFDRSVITQLRAVVAKRPFDLIWSNNVKSHFLVRWAGLNRSRSWVAFHHGYTSTDTRTRIYNQLDWWSLQAADQVLTSAKAFVSDLRRKQIQPNQIHVQHMPIRPFSPVPEERRTEVRRSLGIDGRTRVLLSVGRLSKEKGHADLVRAFPQMRESAGPLPLRLVLVGEGPERSRIEELCARLGLTDSVTLVGQQDNPDPYYAIADVFVLPSHSEGSPNVLLEAMAAGVPVVATEVGGVPELVCNGSDALLVEQGDIVGLASAASRLLTDRGLRERLVSSARQIISRNTPEAYFRSIVSVFSQECAHGD